MFSLIASKPSEIQNQNSKWKNTGANPEMDSMLSEMCWVHLTFFWTQETVPFRLEILWLYEPRMIHTIKALEKKNTWEYKNKLNLEHYHF